jgi:hypothetical protein
MRGYRDLELAVMRSSAETASFTPNRGRGAMPPGQIPGMGGSPHAGVTVRVTQPRATRLPAIKETG